MRHTITECQKCQLYKNQHPLVGRDVKRKHVDIFWVGLSAVKVDDIKSSLPLSDDTKTGSVVSSIEKKCARTVCYRTNLVKCLPLRNEKIRYPTIKEMGKCLEHLNNEISLLNPLAVFLLGRQVAEFVLKRNGHKLPKLDNSFEYNAFEIDGCSFIPIHHPSYILIYKRKLIDQYIEKVSNKALHLTRNSSENFRAYSSA